MIKLNITFKNEIIEVTVKSLIKADADMLIISDWKNMMTSPIIFKKPSIIIKHESL